MRLEGAGQLKAILSNLPKPDRERVLAFCRKHGPIPPVKKKGGKNG